MSPFQSDQDMSPPVTPAAYVLSENMKVCWHSMHTTLKHRHTHTQYIHVVSHPPRPPINQKLPPTVFVCSRISH